MTELVEYRPNLPLLRKILDHIDAHPEEWNQMTYAVPTTCGTAFCVAGHAVNMTEGVVLFRDAELADAGYVEPASGEPWFEAGQRALNLSVTDAHHLFYMTNTRDDVQRIAEGIAEKAGERL